MFFKATNTANNFYAVSGKVGKVAKNKRASERDCKLLARDEGSDGDGMRAFFSAM